MSNNALAPIEEKVKSFKSYIKYLLEVMDKESVFGVGGIDGIKEPEEVCSEIAKNYLHKLQDDLFDSVRDKIKEQTITINNGSEIRVALVQYLIGLDSLYHDVQGFEEFNRNNRLQKKLDFIEAPLKSKKYRKTLELLIIKCISLTQNHIKKLFQQIVEEYSTFWDADEELIKSLTNRINEKELKEIIFNILGGNTSLKSIEPTADEINAYYVKDTLRFYSPKQIETLFNGLNTKFIKCELVDFQAIFDGKFENKIEWISDGKFRETTFLIILLLMVSAVTPEKFETEDVPLILCDFIIKRFDFKDSNEKAKRLDFNDRNKKAKSSFITNRTNFVKYLVGELTKDKNSKNLPAKKITLISIVKKAFNIKYDIPIQKKT